MGFAMGNYYFTSADDGSKTQVEYTFGYKKNDDGKLRIFLHHSSVPYSTGAPKETASNDEVRQGQAARTSARCLKHHEFMRLWVRFFALGSSCAEATVLLMRRI